MNCCNVYEKKHIIFLVSGLLLFLDRECNKNLVCFFFAMGSKEFTDFPHVYWNTKIRSRFLLVVVTVEPG